MLTVRRALTMGGLASSKLVAGHQGLDNEIRSVEIIEVPDVQGWVKPNDMAVTCGFAIRENAQAQISLIRALTDGKAAALAVKPSRFLGESMPRVMIEVANEQGLPLIEVPTGMAYTEITLPILSAILNEQISQLQYASHIHGVLIRSVIENQGVGSIAEVVSRIVGSQIYIVDQSGHLLASSGDNSDYARVNSCLRNKLCHSSLDRSRAVISPTGVGVWEGDFLCLPAIGKGGVLGYLIADRSEHGKLSVFEETALQESVTVLVLELTKRRIVQETEIEMKKRLLQEHAFAQLVNSTQPANRVNLSGLNFDDPYVVIVAKAQGDPSESGPGQAQLWVKESLESILDGVKVPEIIQWLPVSLDKGRDELTLICSGIDCVGEGWLSESAIKALQRFRMEISLCTGIKALLGVSRVHTGTKSFTVAEEEARKAVALGHVGTISDGTAFFQYMAVHEFISHVGVDVQAKFAKDNLRQLLNEDEYPDLTKTLRIFLQCGGQVTQAARKLFIHRNTLNYRLEKISLLLGCDVRDAQNQFTLSLALLAGLLSGVVQE